MTYPDGRGQTEAISNIADSEFLTHSAFGTRNASSTSGPWWAGVRHLLIGGMIDLTREFGDEALLFVVCSKGAKQCAKAIGGHSERTQHAIAELESAYADLNANDGDGSKFDEMILWVKQKCEGSCSIALDPVIVVMEATGGYENQLVQALQLLCIIDALGLGYPLRGCVSAEPRSVSPGNDEFTPPMLIEHVG